MKASMIWLMSLAPFLSKEYFLLLTTTMAAALCNSLSLCFSLLEVMVRRSAIDVLPV